MTSNEVPQTYRFDGHTYIVEDNPVVKHIAGIPVVGRLHSPECDCTGTETDMIDRFLAGEFE